MPLQRYYHEVIKKNWYKIIDENASLRWEVVVVVVVVVSLSRPLLGGYAAV